VQPGIFRQEALDRLSSPEQLDQLMKVADPKRWIALTAVGVLLLGALIWGFVGRVESTVQADCVIIPKSGTYDIVTTTEGTVRDVLVQRGDQIAAGEPVAVVETIDGARQDIVAPVPGEVIERLATSGDFVEVGTPLVNFDREDDDLAVLMYVSPSVSGELEPGMEANISPDTATREQYGFLEGQVEEIAPFPSTRAGMIALLNNDTLAEDLTSASGGTPVEVWVTPDAASTPTGFKWSNSDGPEKLRAGTLCTAEVKLTERRPLELLQP
jgi:multidrug resistance efflux pump